MSFSVARGAVIARREYLSTIRRKGFLFSLMLTPVLFAVITGIQVLTASDDAKDALRAGAIAVVDSSGLLANAPRTFTNEAPTDASAFTAPKKTRAPQAPRTAVTFYPDTAAAMAALNRGAVRQVVLVPADYLEHGNVRRFKLASNLFTSTDERAVGRWLARGILAGAVDSMRADRASRPLSGLQLFVPSHAGVFELHDDRRDLVDFFVPFLLGMLLSIAIITGGQYLLQGVTEEKESRILESLLCTVTPEELMFGKLVGLGGAGLTLVAAWSVMGAYVGGPIAMAANFHMSPLLIVFGVTYFLLGYLFYASLMTGIGAVASNLREANQMALMFTFGNFIPFYMLTKIIGHPDSQLAIGMSIFPLTAPTSMLMRLAATDMGVPAWQLALSLAILAGSAWLAVVASARVFRIGLLLYGKTPNLPEILRWARQG
jgi:ABC-2 type transport system permease protein